MDITFYCVTHGLISNEKADYSTSHEREAENDFRISPQSSRSTDGSSESDGFGAKCVQATNLDEALHKVGVESEIIRIPGGMHRTGGWHKLPGVPNWEVQMTEWLNHTLGHQGPVGEGIRKREPAPASG
jgi:hypothetical protein